MPFSTEQALFGQRPDIGTALFGNAVFGLIVISRTVTITIEARGFVSEAGIDRMYYARINRGASVQVLTGA